MFQIQKLIFYFKNYPGSKTTTMSTQQEYIQGLVRNETKLSLQEFFTDIHQRFYSKQDISFMEYFLELTEHEGEFYVHHEKLVEYGVMSSKKSSHVKLKLDALELVEAIDYRLLPDIWQQWEGSRGIKHINVYMLIPEAFKTCLMRARRYPNQTVDPTIYSKYYLLLEKIHKLYTDYENKLLNIQLEQKDQQLIKTYHQLEQKDVQLEQKDHQLEQKDALVLRLNEMLIDSTSIPKTQVVYIATSPNYAQQNRFKVGGVESEDKLISRLSTYNGRSATGDLFYFSDWFLVHNYREVENRLKDLLGRFRDNKSKEIYVLHYTKLKYILQYLVDNYNEETDLVNKHLLDFISSLDSNVVESYVPKERCLKKIKISEVGKPDFEIEGNTNEELEKKIELYFRNLDIEIKIVTSKTVFDDLGVKKKRLELFALLSAIGKKMRPDVKIARR